MFFKAPCAVASFLHLVDFIPTSEGTEVNIGERGVVFLTLLILLISWLLLILLLILSLVSNSVDRVGIGTKLAVSVDLGLLINGILNDIQQKKSQGGVDLGI